MSIFRDADLLQILKLHPLKSHLAKALDTADFFRRDVEAISAEKNLSAAGRDNERRKLLRAAVRDNRDGRGAVDDLKAKLEAKSAAVKRPPLDRTQVAADDRREARLILRGMDRGERALLLSGAGADPDFQDAMLERKPIFSGLMAGEQFLVDAAREQRLAGLFAPELAEIEELKGVVAEADMVFDRAFVGLKLYSEMEDRTFTEFVTPIMTRKNEPWVTSDRTQVVEIGADGKATYRPATVDEAKNGRVFSEAAYLADRAA
jgi:hypothetical protein